MLISESCNVGLTPVINPNLAELTRARLSHVDQNYLRADTIAAANALLIEAQSGVELAQLWGGGLLASVDGLRFVVPTRTINAAPSPKYFGYKRGLTWLNAVNDQVSGIGAMVVPGTPRDSLFILDTLLNLDGGVKPQLVATDHASYSDAVFGLFKILGYRFAPRFRDLADQRFWRAELPNGQTSHYGPLELIARNHVNLKRTKTSGRTCSGSPARWSPTRSAPMTCYACSAVAGTPPRSGRGSPSTGALTRRCTCSASSTPSTTPTADG